jgi:hypothetical protein
MKGEMEIGIPEIDAGSPISLPERESQESGSLYAKTHLWQKDIQ